MKKIILVAALVLGFAAAAVAQPRAIGIRLGMSTEATYQHTLGENFIEANVGIFSYNALNASASYNWMVARPDWTSRGEWGVYAGPGVAMGFCFDILNPGFNVSAMGQVGLEYSFWFPLQLSVDLRPQVGVLFGNRVQFYTDGLYGFVPCISARYKF